MKQTFFSLELKEELKAKDEKIRGKFGTSTSRFLKKQNIQLKMNLCRTNRNRTDCSTYVLQLKELQQIIDEKNTQLTEKTEELLKVTSAEPQRQLQDRLNDLVDGIKDGDNEYTKLNLENQLEDIRNQIAEKTLLLGSSDKRIANLSMCPVSVRVTELSNSIRVLKNFTRISNHWKTRYQSLKLQALKTPEVNNQLHCNVPQSSTYKDVVFDRPLNNFSELQKRLDLTRRQLQDSELRLQEADTKNFEMGVNISYLLIFLFFPSLYVQNNTVAVSLLVMEIADLRTQLKKAQKKAVAERNAMDLQRQLQQSQEDTDRLQRQLHEKDANHKALQQELEEMRREKNKLQGAYHNLQNEKNNLEDIVQDLQNKLSDLDDKTIYAMKSTLDPNTANPRILLSAENAEMSTTEQIQNIPDHPGRFNIAFAVLGMTGFSSGRHYWEVSVAGKLCYHLGMASESAQRRGTIIFSPTKGFWTVVLNKQGQFKAVERRHAIIPLETQPLRLGILLDYKKGQISFYDAGTRSHLYSFVQQSFTDKIYPFINFCVEDIESQTPIVINSPGSIDWIK
ncbi:hypothetical protein F7725_011810 [Dissostichus mawsoni]|uniref:B30.2/SPRY domain-containing protein n=1 Tax=Dissostichus mawsoni TaxID=36200 RepID=A0A7J5ZC00_DISMA|nr:hypothetical protein F7725_011810 [Dissostichus mawsoni]